MTDPKGMLEHLISIRRSRPRCEFSGVPKFRCRGCQEEERKMLRDREHFDRIRDRYRTIRHREETYRREVLYARYRDVRPPRLWLTKGEQDKLAAFDRQINRESDRMFLLLDRIGGRSWRHGVPWWWVMEQLSFDDAVTKGDLSVVPPVPFGGSEREVERFAQAVA